MDQPKLDKALSKNDSVFETPIKERVEHKLDDMADKGTEAANKLYEMRNFAGSNSSAASVTRLESEDFEHISVSSIEDFDKQNGELNGVSASKSTHESNDKESKMNQSRKADGIADALEMDTKGHKVSGIAQGGVTKMNTETPMSGVDTESLMKSGLDDIDGDASNTDEPDCNVNNSVGIHSVIGDSAEDSKTTDDGENEGGSSSGLLEEPVSTERRVSFSLEEYMEERESLYNAELRRASENMLGDNKEPRNYR